MRHERLVSAGDGGSREGMSNRVVCAEMHVRAAREMLEGMEGDGVGEVVEALKEAREWLVEAQNFLEKVGMDSGKIGNDGEIS